MSISDIQVSNYVKVLIDGSELEEVQSVGEITDEATIIDVPSYGSQYLRKVVGSKNAGSLEIVVNIIPDATAAPIQQALRDAYASGVSVAVQVQMLNEAGDAGDEVTFNGLVSSASITNEFDSVRTQTFNIAIDGAVSEPTSITF